MEKKILYVASTFGHLKTFHIPYLEQLMSLGYEVHAMGAGDPAGLPDGVQTIPMPFEKKMASLGNFKCALRIRKMVRQEGYDLVSVHTSLAAFFTRLGILFSGKRPWVINTVHGYLFDEKSSWKKRTVLLAAEKLTRPVTNVVAVMNEQDRQIAEKHRLYKDQLVFLDGMGIDVSRFEKTPRTIEAVQALRREYFLAPKDFVMVCAAEFSNRKNQMFLVRALQRLKREGIPCRLILAGDGELFESTKSLAVQLSVRMETRFPGYTRDLAPYFYLADVSVSASRIEGLPFQIMEAMACGLPVIASRIKGHEDLVEQGANGLLFDFDDLEAFCQAVRQLYEDRPLREKMGQTGLEKVRRYRLEKVLPENMEKLYPQHPTAE
ncbi:MAG: glycosyltransferase family 4 protein [Oscillospiraceae bacterium]|nr:glycosyltransferase family 4 protein [Oscillospiraceae bacterium]